MKLIFKFKLLSVVVLALTFIIISQQFNINKIFTKSTEPFDLKMVKIDPGSYTLHIPINNSIKVIYIDKKVKIKQPFYIGAYEVTNDQWNACFKDKGCSKTANMKPGEHGNHPVVRVNWHDALQFTKWLSKKSKQVYRLPTEEEWVYAAYMGKDHIGENLEYDYSNVASTVIPKITQPIGFYKSNKWGIYDISGNVWEWTINCWYGSAQNVLKERSLDEINNIEACTTRITQGEHRAHIPDFIQDTYNGGCATIRPAANLGFRVLREVTL